MSRIILDFRNGQRRDAEFPQKQHTVLSSNVLIWSAICYEDKSSLRSNPSSLIAYWYFINVLHPVLLPFFQDVPNANLQ